MAFEIEKITLRVVRLPLREPFRVSFGTVENRDQLIIAMQGGGITGWGEAAVLPFPYYNHETIGTALHILRDFVIPIFFARKPESPAEANDAFKKIIGHRITRSGVEMAYWDWTARVKHMPLYRLLGGVRSEIPVGVSVPLFDSVGVLLDKIHTFLEQKYHKIKIKIMPGHDIALLERIRTLFGDIPLMVDANCAYTLRDIDVLKRLDNFDLMMVEQPLRAGDVWEHHKLQKQIRTPICLDESIEYAQDAHMALEVGACRIINVKPGRVGGLSEAKAIHDLTDQQGAPIWCGGMLETGIGRAINMAFATLPNCRFPGDIGESARYYHEDIVTPEIILSASGTLRLPDSPGLGFDIDLDKLKRFTKHEEVFSAG